MVVDTEIDRKGKRMKTDKRRNQRIIEAIDL